MFDVGFWELSIIAIVALLVIGPERLPGVARTAGLWLGKVRGFVTSVKADIDKELQADELKKILDRQAKSSGLHEILEETEKSINNIQQPDYLVRSSDNDEAMKQELEMMSSGSGVEQSTPAPESEEKQPETPSQDARQTDTPPSDAKAKTVPDDATQSDTQPSEQKEEHGPTRPQQ